jgi:PKD repeat protein
VSLMAVNTGGHNTTTQPGYITVSAPVATATPTHVQTTLSTTVLPTETQSAAETTVPPASDGVLSSWTLPLIGVVILVLGIIALILRAGGRSGGGKRRSRGRDL